MFFGNNRYLQDYQNKIFDRTESNMLYNLGNGHGKININIHHK